MRLVFSMVLSVSLAAAPSLAGAGGNPFKHDWRFENEGTLLISNYTAPPPFSLSGEPEATLAFEAARLPPKSPSLGAVVQDEIRVIRAEVVLADYLEQDGRKPHQGIAYWFEDIAGQRVAFIKYRIAGTAAHHLPTPRTAIHAIAIKDGYLIFFHLTALSTAHQDEVRGDQIRLIQEVLPRFPPRAR